MCSQVNAKLWSNYEMIFDCAEMEKYLIKIILFDI